MVVAVVLSWVLAPVNSALVSDQNAVDLAGAGTVASAWGGKPEGGKGDLGSTRMVAAPVGRIGAAVASTRCAMPTPPRSLGGEVRVPFLSLFMSSVAQFG